MSEYLPEGKLISEQENINILHSLKMLEDAKNSEKILEAKACVCDSSHNLIVDLAGIKCFPVKKHNANALTHTFQGCDAEILCLPA